MFGAVMKNVSSLCQKRCFATQASKPRTAIYAGTFDPPTSGHLDIMTRGLSLCDKLYIGIAVNTAKK